MHDQNHNAFSCHWLLSFALTLLVLALAAPPANATWGTGGDGLPVTVFPANVSPFEVHVLADGVGGAFVLWTDRRNVHRDVCLQRLTSSGAVASGWPTNAPLVLSSGSYDHLEPDMVSDGAGGVYVCWTRRYYESTYSDGDIYVQRVTSAGAVASGWPSGGALVCNATGDQHDAQVVTATDGNAILAWLDRRGAGEGGGLYLQRMNASNGQRLWTTTGVRPSDSNGPGAQFSLTTDDVGGSVIAFVNDVNDGRLVVRQVTSSGSMGWGDDLGDQDALFPCIVRDGQFAFHIVYTSNPAGSDPGDLYYRRILLDGTLASYLPITLSTASGWQALGRIVPDGSGGVLVAWMGEVSNCFAPFVQHITADGALASCWPAGGRQVYDGNYCGGTPPYPVISSDRQGGAVIVYDTGSVIGASQVRADGSLDPSYGTPIVLTDAGSAHFPAGAVTESGKFIAAWVDARDTASVYANRQSFGSLGNVAGVEDLTAAHNGRHTVMLTWTSVDDDATFGAAASYDVRYSGSSIGEADFDQCRQIGLIPSLGAGEAQCATAFNLASCSPYYFAIRTIYGCGELSALGQVEQGSTTCSGNRDYSCDDGGASAIREGGEAGGVTLHLALTVIRPNPVRDHGLIEYEVPAYLAGAPLEAAVFDVAGRRLSVLEDGVAQPGRHQIAVGRSGGLQAGVYFVRLRVGSEERRATLLVLN